MSSKKELLARARAEYLAKLEENYESEESESDEPEEKTPEKTPEIIVKPREDTINLAKIKELEEHIKALESRPIPISIPLVLPPPVNKYASLF